MSAIVLRIIEVAFRWVFKTSKETSEKAKQDLVVAVGSLAKMGVARLREFLAAIPMFVLFVRELIIRRKEFEAQSELMLVGAGAALTTLLTIFFVGTLSALPTQIALILAYPLLGIPLLFATGLTLSALVVFLVWIIIFVLNLAFADSLIFRDVRDRFLTKKTQEILIEVQNQIENSGADLTSLSAVVEQSLIDRGAKGNAEKVEGKLRQVSESKMVTSQLLTDKWFNRFRKQSKSDELTIVDVKADAESEIRSRKQEMREQSNARKEKASIRNRQA